MSCEVFAAEGDEPGVGVGRVLDLMGLEDALRAGEVLVKVNFVSAYTELSATPVEAVEELVKRLAGKCRVVVAESPTIGSFQEAVRRFDYRRLLDYGVELLDLAGDDYEDFYVWDRRLQRSVRVRVARSILESRYLVSVVRPKTHDTVIVTLSIKNVVVGGIMPGDRHRIHQGYPAINLNIAYLATRMMPRLALIDGAVGMEGAGPTGGTPARLGFSVGGRNAATVDVLMSTLMGFDPRSVGYLYYLSRWGYGCIDPAAFRVVGLGDWRSRVRRFRPHSTYREQLNWRIGGEQLRRIEGELLEEGVIRRSYQ